MGIIILLAVAPMFDYKSFIDMYRVNKWDLLPFMISFWGSLILDIQYGVGAAVILSILYLLYYAARSV